MGFQNKAGSIILDATLTDVGRRHMANGKFEITKFALGDDEVVYTTGVDDEGAFVITTAPPTFEAIVEPSSAIIHGLIDIGSRNDVMYIPEYLLNTYINNAVSEYNGVIYLSVNKETTEKLSTALDFDTYILENEAEKSNFLLFESGISPRTGALPTSILGTEETKRRYLYNLKLHDQYAFVYLDSRFFNNAMTSPMNNSGVSLTSTGVQKSTLQPLVRHQKISIPAPSPNYDTYYCKTAFNNVYDVTGIDTKEVSMFSGPRNCFVALNFIVNDKMKSKSNGAADVRYTKFGKTGQNLFSDGNLYDYVDTNVMIEGASTTRTSIATIRIIRFSGT